MSMNEPGDRSRALGNVFKGGGGISKALIDRLRKRPGTGPAGSRPGPRSLSARDPRVPAATTCPRTASCAASRSCASRPTARSRTTSGSASRAARYGLPPLPAEATLEDALERGYIHDNVQTRMLSGLAEPFGEVDRRDARAGEAQPARGARLLRAHRALRRVAGARQAAARLSHHPLHVQRPGERGPRRGATSSRRAASRRRRPATATTSSSTATPSELFDDAPEREELDFEVELAALRAAKAERRRPISRRRPGPRFDGDEAGVADAARRTGGAAAHGVGSSPRNGGQGRRPPARATGALKLQVGRVRRPCRRGSKELEREVERLESALEGAGARAAKVERLKADAEPASGREGPRPPKARPSGARSARRRQAAGRRQPARRTGSSRSGRSATQAGRREARPVAPQAKREARRRDEARRAAADSARPAAAGAKPKRRSRLRRRARAADSRQRTAGTRRRRGATMAKRVDRRLRKRRAGRSGAGSERQKATPARALDGNGAEADGSRPPSG